MADIPRQGALSPLSCHRRRCAAGLGEVRQVVGDRCWWNAGCRAAMARMLLSRW
jgi:hypothetical protein